MRIGFLHLANLIKRYGESDGARRYNGSGSAAEAYSRDLLVKARRWESIIGGLEAPTPSSPKLLRKGDEGAGVEQLTKRLSRVRSPKTKQPYLDGVSRVLTGAVAEAVRDFQRDHGLEVDGVAGPQTRSTLRTTD
jgi:murein L,D-transpeptidase YcbB/YkuD